MSKNFFRYHLPRSWLKPTQNLLVLFEELGGDPTRITLVKRSVTTVCADIAEYHPNIKNWQIESYGKPEEFRKPKIHLHCGPGQTISSIKFASFGTPLGTCGSFQKGTCHAPTSYAILEKVHSTSLVHVAKTRMRHISKTCFIWLFDVAEVHWAGEMRSGDIEQ